MPDTSKLTAAIREMRAAWNSYSRACDELHQLIEPGTVVLQKLPEGVAPKRLPAGSFVLSGAVSFQSARG